MNNSRLSLPRSLRIICFTCCLGLLLLAAAPHAPAPVRADNADAPAKAPKVTIAPSAALQSGNNVVGKWDTTLYPLTTVPVHISLLPNERLLYWGRDKDTTPQKWDRAGSCLTYNRTWNLSTNDEITIPNNTTNLFCSGHSFLPDGRLLVTGGHSRWEPAPDQEAIGEDDVNVFDYRNNTWTRVGFMPRGRWYPSNVTLGSGETVVMAGAYWDGVTMRTATDGTGRSVPSVALNPSADVYTLAGHVRPTNTVASPVVENYPYLHLAPNGNVFIAGPGPFPSRFFDPYANALAGQYTTGPDYTPNHFEGSAVVYDAVNGKILMTGGRTTVAGTVLDTAETFNLSATPAPTVWQTSQSSQVAPLNIRRKYHTSTILPNGQVLVTGGTQCTGGPTFVCSGGAAYNPELWTPPNGATPDTWTTMAAPTPRPPTYPSGIPRIYHSVALLLPDARVLVGGGGLPADGGEVANGVNCVPALGINNPVECRTFGHKDAEIFSPPYLFNPDGSPATQPVITSAPPAVTYGQTFSISVSNPGSITKASLVRLPSVTHGFNADQRVYLMDATVSGASSVNVTAPAKANQLPPGHYMLFIMNSAGVPSKAKIVQVQQDDGYLDGADCTQIWGWAWDRNAPNTPVNVNIYDGNTLIASNVAANLFRQDLLNAGKGNGYHAFVINTPASLKDGKPHSVSVRFASGTNSQNNLGSSPRQIVCGLPMFPLATYPVTEVGAGGQTWEQAIRFSSAIPGKITHLRFYKANGESTGHTGRIWSDTGGMLRSQPFTSESVSGWQEVQLSSSLTITPGVIYRVSYNVNLVGAKVQSAFGPPIVNWPLSALTGTYSTPAGSFPNTGSTSNFLADVRFSAP
jgi:hypothetical protein